MKILVTYYSYSGITDKVINAYKDILSKSNEVTIQRLRPKEEIKTFFAQCRAAFAKKRAELQDGIDFDASRYDIILIGSPVWAFAPAPAVNTYLDKLSGITAKRAVILLTSGSGAGVGNCFSYIRNILRNKGASTINEVNVPNSKMGQPAAIASSISALF
jgi:multimeric flavodoxin WrbA